MPNDLFDQILDDSDPDGEILYPERYPDYPSLERIDESKKVESPIISRITSLLEISRAVENPVWAVSFEEIQFLLIDLGLVLCELSEKTFAGEEVKEVPWRSDPLGNVLMTHQKVFRKDQSSLLHHLGYQLLESLGVASKIHRKEQMNFLPLQLDDNDDTRSEDILAAKRLIRELRKENLSLDRRNERLYHRLKRLEPREPEEIREFLIQIRENQMLLLDSWSNVEKIIADAVDQDIENSIQSLLKSFFDSKRQKTNSTDFMSVDKGMHRIRPRKSERAQNAKSQLDSLEW